jgi:hypothetical protein
VHIFARNYLIENENFMFGIGQSLAISFCAVRQLQYSVRKRTETAPPRQLFRSKIGAARSVEAHVSRGAV